MTMVMAMNTKPQTHITRTSIIKAITTIRNILSMASSRKTMDNTIKGMEMVVTMTSRRFGLHALHTLCSRVMLQGILQC